MLAQYNNTAYNMKAFKGISRGVFEIVESHQKKVTLYISRHQHGEPFQQVFIGP